jgi:AraC family L-rhamnose operon transcriptional activator RhaR
MRAINLLNPSIFPIAVTRMNPQESMYDHHHENLELVLITSGSGAHRAAGGPYPLRRGDVFMIPIGMPHGFEDTRELCLINIAYDPARLELPLHRLALLPGYQPLVLLEPRLRGQQGFAGHLHLSEEAMNGLVRLVDELEQELRQREPGWEQAANAWLLQILVRLARSYALSDTPEARMVVRLAGVLHFIENHLGASLELASLSAHGGMSKSTLQRSFRTVFGSSVRQYVLELRLQAARQLLLNSDLPIRSIAKRVGISDANYFSRLFQAKMSMTPRTFRERRPNLANAPKTGQPSDS